MKKILTAALAAVTMTATAQAAPVPLVDLSRDGLVAIRMLVAWDCRQQIGASYYSLAKTLAYDEWSKSVGPAAAEAQVLRVDAQFVAGDYKKQTGKTPERCLYVFNDLTLRIRMMDESGAANAPGY